MLSKILTNSTWISKVEVCWTLNFRNMSQFAFLNSINNAVKMDEPITKGPIPRYEKRKILENRYKIVLKYVPILDSFKFSFLFSYSNLNSSMLNSSKSSSMSSGKTPKKHIDIYNKKTPSKTPKKSPGNYPVKLERDCSFG